VRHSSVVATGMAPHYRLIRLHQACLRPSARMHCIHVLRICALAMAEQCCSPCKLQSLVWAKDAEPCFSSSAVFC
jgi:hypothetical protein